MRVYEFSKKHNMTSKELLDLLSQHGFEFFSHMAVLTEQALVFLDKHFNSTQEKAKTPSKIEEPSPKKVEPIHKDVRGHVQVQEPSKVLEKNKGKEIEKPIKIIKDTPKEQPKEHKKVQQVVSPLVQKEIPRVIEEPKKEIKSLRKEPMSPNTFSQESGIPLSQIIVTLLRGGFMATKNQILPIEKIEMLAQTFSILLIEVPLVQQESLHVSSFAQAHVQTDNNKETVTRSPVVVVVGHVDHGKTTLMDYIRKTRVAAREKGGITQHLGAYEVKTSHGTIVFIDTPGHEAFSMMRVRGIKVADVVILIVAADDGVKPQTIEAIKAAQAVKLPIVVAINKVDKVAPAQLEVVRQQLAQQGLVPEEWGGEISSVAISAKTGQGVDDLLEVVALHAEMLDLKASLVEPVLGYVLESSLEKGRGPVATVITQHGILRIGDYFAAGSASGRVSSLIDSYGRQVRETMPSQPVRVAGFSVLPVAGDMFRVGSMQQVRDLAETKIVRRDEQLTSKSLDKESIALVIKTDNMSSLEAIKASLEKISAKAFKKLSILRSGVGELNESDVEYAADVNALVYLLHVKAQANAALLSSRLGITIKGFDIIYKFLEELELIAQQGRPIKMIQKKMGEAVVLKVFDIKKLGIVAGARVASGVLSKDGKLVVWRGKNKVGEGLITSLQRDKKAVKEVHKGFECAFMIDGFTSWEVDDRVECFVMVPSQE